ncbi:MAG: hypothetical protein A4S08_12940 [Proteobacteria bacterium SG_bin4]|nr:MAG: hypothetical protein A4S08_12940 [Proteobacteria bacterium SG_bin4]
MKRFLKKQEHNSASRFFDKVENRNAPSQTITDHREAAIQQRRLLPVLNNAPQSVMQRKISDQINQSPRMLAQRMAFSVITQGVKQQRHKELLTPVGSNRNQTVLLKTAQLRNSSTPNWYQEYQSIPAIHAQGIGNYIQHVELGEIVNGEQQGVHALTNGNAPPNVTIVEEQNVDYNSIGKILWYFTNSPRGNGTVHNPIPVKNSTVFPTRLSNAFGGITGVRALMKAAAAGNGLGAISSGAGLQGAVRHAAPSIYPVGSALRPQNQAFNIGATHYVVI